MILIFPKQFFTRSGFAFEEKKFFCAIVFDGNYNISWFVIWIIILFSELVGGKAEKVQKELELED